MSIDILQERIRRLKTPILVGLDPYLPALPPHIVRQAFGEQGQTPEGAAAAYYTFCTELIDRLGGMVPGIKLQPACFEALGAPGVAQMQRISQYAGEKGCYVLMDSMSSTAGVTAELTAQTLFGGLSLGGETRKLYRCDGITLNPLLGSDGVKPYLPYCKKEKKNLFLLLKSSNKSGREVQDLLSGDRVIYTAMADLARRWGGDMIGKCGYSEIGAVVGATFPQALKQLRAQYDRLFFLVPGYGAQGGNAKNVRFAFDPLGHGAVITASRSILCAWQKEGSDGTDYLDCAEKAVKKIRTEIGKYVTIL